MLIARRRSGYTLIELMVVVTIIALLVSLLLSAVAKTLERINEVRTRTEISEMEVALSAFMSDYSLSDPPPSVLVLNEAAPQSGPSSNFLVKTFGKMVGLQPNPDPLTKLKKPFIPLPIDWNQDGVIQSQPWILEGEQCLVFYLGGIGGNQGFSTYSANPATPGGKRRGPYMTFNPARLVLGNAVNPVLNAFPVYLDAWQVKLGPKPYAYFSSQGILNSGYMANGFPVPDCVSIGANPYWTAQNANNVPTVFTNPNTYQVISAGKDGVFGGGIWLPTSGIQGAGADDQANFSAAKLVAGQQ